MSSPCLHLLLLLLCLFPAAITSSAKLNPFTEKAALIRYWNRKVPNNLLHPPFFLSKLTPLSAADATAFSSLAVPDPFKLTSRLSALCSAANLLCPSSTSPSPSLSSSPRDSAFSAYQNSNFSNYGTDSADALFLQELLRQPQRPGRHLSPLRSRLRRPHRHLLHLRPRRQCGDRQFHLIRN
ncbi:hypothetical protein HPP92_009696 [Vanilla planifolia]|uniref:Uncharacterized protein n=1 Tax=Vanilla planifolia TaxID=51239 RepID=A0A835V4Z7_VANPL|nr:hypothetical protein HPP92_009696 [Vanilla planifolia]